MSTVVPFVPGSLADAEETLSRLRERQAESIDRGSPGPGPAAIREAERAVEAARFLADTAGLPRAAAMIRFVGHWRILARAAGRSETDGQQLAADFRAVWPDAGPSEFSAALAEFARLTADFIRQYRPANRSGGGR